MRFLRIPTHVSRVAVLGVMGSVVALSAYVTYERVVNRKPMRLQRDADGVWRWLTMEQYLEEQCRVRVMRALPREPVRCGLDGALGCALVGCDVSRCARSVSHAASQGAARRRPNERNRAAAVRGASVGRRPARVPGTGLLALALSRCARGPHPIAPRQSRRTRSRYTRSGGCCVQKARAAAPLPRSRP